MSKISGYVGVSVEGTILQFKFGLGAWKILLEENGYKSMPELATVPDAVLVPKIFHAGLEYYRRINKPEEPAYTQDKVCVFIDEMDQKDYEKVYEAWLNSKYFNTTFKDMVETGIKAAKEAQKKSLKKAQA